MVLIVPWYHVMPLILKKSWYHGCLGRSIVPSSITVLHSSVWIIDALPSPFRERDRYRYRSMCQKIKYVWLGFNVFKGLLFYMTISVK